MGVRGRRPKDLPPPPEDPGQMAKWEELRAKITAEKRATFLRLLAKGASASSAAEGANISRNTLYQWREQDGEFAQQWAQALEEQLAMAEAEVLRRGLEKSDLLLIFWVKAHNPQYKETVRQEHTGKDGGEILTRGIIEYTIRDSPPAQGQLQLQPGSEPGYLQETGGGEQKADPIPGEPE